MASQKHVDMYKLEPDDIQGMLADAARVLTQPKDKEVMRRLVSSTRATDPAEWDKRRIAAMLAKAGKMHEAEMVVHDIEVEWERGDALLQMARAVKEIGDDFHCRCLLRVAVLEAQKGQESERHQDRLDASGVLAEVACFLHDIGETEEARQVVATITDDMRREQLADHIAELEPLPIPENDVEELDLDDSPSQSITPI